MFSSLLLTILGLFAYFQLNYSKSALFTLFLASLHFSHYCIIV
jgi:hypothetical protein